MRSIIRPHELRAWHGPSLLIVDTRGECGDASTLTGLFHRETRFLSTLAFTLNGRKPWLCESSQVSARTLLFTFVYPELDTFGGGGSGQSDDAESTDSDGIAHRTIAIRLRYDVEIAGCRVALTVANHGRRAVTCTFAWSVGADFADLQEAHAGQRQQTAVVEHIVRPDQLTLAYGHDGLPLRTRLRFAGARLELSDGRAAGLLHLEPQERRACEIDIQAIDSDAPFAGEGLRARQDHVEHWRAALTRVTCPANEGAAAVLRSNITDFASLPMLEGPPDEWLACQAGVPLYPAIFGRDALTAGWQAAVLDGGASLDASLTLLGRRQAAREDHGRDAEPGRILHSMRRGPLARLQLNPYAAYYGDFAGPLMFVIGLAHLYSWSGDVASIRRHWDAARRVMDWARTLGDRDRDGYLEYESRSSHGTKNQGWKDSGDAVVYDDGAPVKPPIATCEIQGYWFAAQQLMVVLCTVMGAYADARAFWRSARELKARFNRDWWNEADGSIALALDSGKSPVWGVTSNIGHCIATGIVADDHLPPAVGRLFAPDMFSGWGIRTLSDRHRSYDPLSYHRGTVWPVEQATIAFGLRRFGFDARALDLVRAMFDLASLYPGHRIPECVGGYPRRLDEPPGAYPRANALQLWNASAFPLLIHTVLGLQPVAALELLVVDPVLPSWLPEVVLHDLQLGQAKATIRFWRDGVGRSHTEVIEKRGTLRVVRQPPPESLSARPRDRMRALAESVLGT